MNAGFALLLSSLPIAAMAGSIDIPDELQQCRREGEPELRLDCFDRLAIRHSPPRFAGRLGATTDSFSIDGPQRLRYQSDGTIFVMYLRDAGGSIVQNLILHGGGEDSYRIESAGRYSLQVNGDDSWRIWLEPLAP